MKREGFVRFTKGNSDVSHSHVEVPIREVIRGLIAYGGMSPFTIDNFFARGEGVRVTLEGVPARGRQEISIPDGKSGIGEALRYMAALSWHSSRESEKIAHDLTQNLSSNRDKVMAIVRGLSLAASQISPSDQEGFLPGVSQEADDSVIAAACACKAVGIPCRIVGARYGQAWTCWLAYQDDGNWHTIDAVTGLDAPGAMPEPDERIWSYDVELPE
jgi:hypothetical protein